jgi:hypothetical protein
MPPTAQCATSLPFLGRQLAHLRAAVPRLLDMCTVLGDGGEGCVAMCGIQGHVVKLGLYCVLPAGIRVHTVCDLHGTHTRCLHALCIGCGPYIWDVVPFPNGT